MDLLGFLPPPRGLSRVELTVIKTPSITALTAPPGDQALLDLRGISVLAREKKGMRKRKMLGRMKERRGDSSRPDFFGKRRGEGGEDETQRDETESLALGCTAKLMKITVGLLGLYRNIFLK